MAKEPKIEDQSAQPLPNEAATRPRNLSDTPDDLTDSPSDRERLKEEVVYMDLPEVSDIPGQEGIMAPPLGELADTTISSDDEEGLVNDDSSDMDLLTREEL